MPAQLDLLEVLEDPGDDFTGIFGGLASSHTSHTEEQRHVTTQL